MLKNSKQWIGRYALFFVFVISVFWFGDTALAQGVDTVRQSGIFFKLYLLFSNKTLSSFLAGVIFASLIYILMLVKHPAHVYHSLFKSPSEAFSRISARDPNGTYQESFSQFKRKLQVSRGAFFTAVLVFLIQILAFLIFSLIVLQIVSQDDVNAKNVNSQKKINLLIPTLHASTLAGGVECRLDDVQTRECGKCGSQKRFCGDSGFWQSWSACEGEGICAQGEVQNRSCEDGGTQRAHCNNSCQWEFSSCQVPKTESKSEDPQYSVGDFLIRFINSTPLFPIVDKRYDRVPDITQQGTLTIVGKAPALSRVVVSIHSDIVVRTAFTNSLGEWRVEFGAQTLTLGKHTLYGYFVTESFVSPRVVLGEINITPFIKIPETTKKEAMEKIPQVFPRLQEEPLKYSNFSVILEKMRSNETLSRILVLFVTPLVIIFVLLSLMLGFGRRSLSGTLKVLFLQPKMFSKPEVAHNAWGTVYNSISKTPIPWSFISLREVEEKKKRSATFSDMNGRYVFESEPGRYELQVEKADFVFPSGVLTEKSYDEPYSDLYHGELIDIAQFKDVITYDIPLDPMSITLSPKKLIARFTWKRLFPVVSWIGGAVLFLIFLLTSAIIDIFALVFWLILVFVAFYARNYERVENFEVGEILYGKVCDRATELPLSNAVVSVSETKSQVSVGQCVTDKNGRYHLLLGKNHYTLRAWHKKYPPLEEHDITHDVAQPSWLTKTIMLEGTKKK